MVQCMHMMNECMVQCMIHLRIKLQQHDCTIIVALSARDEKRGPS
jgi:hypothetical protein